VQPLPEQYTRRASGLDLRSDAAQNFASGGRAIHRLCYLHAGDVLFARVSESTLVKSEYHRFRAIDLSSGVIGAVEPSPDFVRQWIKMRQIQR
jgi:hypothetical protein